MPVSLLIPHYSCKYSSKETFRIFGSRELIPLWQVRPGIWGLCSAKQCGGTQTSSLCRVLLTQCPLTVILKAYRDPPLAWKRNCLIQTTPWSPCSKTCGLGISVRVSNDNGKCEMRKDRRLCLLRPCEKSVMKTVKVTS